MLLPISKALVQCAIILIGTYLAMHSALTAQITPYSTLKNFSLPKFNDESYRQYTLTGAEGIYDRNGLFTVNAATLYLFSGDADQILKTTVTAPVAFFYFDQQSASGDSGIEIVDDGFYLRGKHWHLDMAEKKITITSEGYIRFESELELDFSEMF
jgi:hypothetical protein